MTDTSIEQPDARSRMPSKTRAAHPANTYKASQLMESMPKPRQLVSCCQTVSPGKCVPVAKPGVGRREYVGGNDGSKRWNAICHNHCTRPQRLRA